MLATITIVCADRSRTEADQSGAEQRRQHVMGAHHQIAFGRWRFAQRLHNRNRSANLRSHCDRVSVVW